MGEERRIIPAELAIPPHDGNTHETIGTWTTTIARLPVSGGWHALVYTKTAEYEFEKDSFLLLAQAEDEAPALHHRFLDRRSPLPLHGSWAERALASGAWTTGEIVQLQSVGITAYRCSPKTGESLRDALSDWRWRRAGCRCRTEADSWWIGC